MQAVGKCESCSNFDFSYNGLGDREAEALGLALKKNYRSVFARATPSLLGSCAESSVQRTAKQSADEHFERSLCACVVWAAPEVLVRRLTRDTAAVRYNAR